MIVHLDTDFLVYALSRSGKERRALMQLMDPSAEIQVSAVMWYEFSRGPRTPEQIAVAHSFFGKEGIVPFTEDLAERAADVFRSLGSPRKRGADIAIGVTAASCEAIFYARNASDFAGIPDLNIRAFG